MNEVVINLHHQMALAGDLELLVMVNTWSARRPVEKVVEIAPGDVALPGEVQLILADVLESELSGGHMK